MPVSRDELRHSVYLLSGPRYGMDIDIHWHYGARCTSIDGSKDLSPRLNNNEMWAWLDGVRAALDRLEKKV